MLLDSDTVHPLIERWLVGQGWTPFAFQRQTWRALAEGRSGLLHVTTGSDKTYAVWLAS